MPVFGPRRSPRLFVCRSQYRLETSAWADGHVTVLLASKAPHIIWQALSKASCTIKSCSIEYSGVSLLRIIPASAKKSGS